MSKFLSNPHLTSSWTITSQGMSADGDDDQRRLDAFLRANPDIREAVLHSIRYGVPNSQSTVNIEPNFNSACGSEPITLPTGVLPPKDAATPGKPHRFVSAIEKFIEGRDDSDVKARTTEDIASVVRNFAKFLAANHPDMGENPWVHQIDSTHISDFIDAEKKRSGRYKDEGGKSRGIKAATLKKRLLDLGTFFRFAHKRLKACTTNPVGDLDDRVADLGRLASKTTNHYAPFTDEQLRLIFQPEEYLAHNRAPDYFWCPLLAAHLGGRLGEFVLATVDDVRQDAYGVWCLSERYPDWVSRMQNALRYSTYSDAIQVIELIGCRPVELLEGVQISLDDQGWFSMKVLRGGKVTEKAGQPWRKISLPVSKLPVHWAKALRNSDSFVVRINDRDEFRNALQRASRAALPDLPYATAYVYRHAFATRMRNAGFSAEKIGALMGHSAAMTQSDYGIRFRGKLRDRRDLSTVARVTVPRKVRPLDKSFLNAVLAKNTKVKLSKQR